MRSDKGFLEFFSADGRVKGVTLLVIVGVLLLFLGGMSLGGGDSSAGEEERAAEMCAMMSGVGDCRVMMTYYPDDESRVYGVLVLCEGAESPAVRERVTSFFCSLYGIGAHRVEIQNLEK